MEEDVIYIYIYMYVYIYMIIWERMKRLVIMITNETS